MNSLFFNMAYGLFALFYLPVFLKKIRQEADPRRLLKERRGNLAHVRRFIGKRLIWIHAVSVGEVMAVRKFLLDLQARADEFYFLLTTVTPTGQRIARTLENERVTVAYFPFDWTASCRRFFDYFRPECLLLAETEIWPNLMTEALKMKVPVGILNARLSPRSFRRYRLLGFMFKPFFEQLDFVLAQTREDARRFLEAGVPQERIHVLGNMKWDEAAETEAPGSLHDLLAEWSFERKDRIWVAGSTHPGEEEKLLRVFKKLRLEFPHLKMLLAPRHIERSRALAKAIGQSGLKSCLGSLRSGRRDFDVLVLDQLGVLKKLYQLADVVFMGGSLVPKGGQNPIEAVRFRKAVLHGPHVFNFEHVYQVLDQEDGARRIQNETDLAPALKGLLENSRARETMGERGRSCIQKLRGATGRHLDRVMHFLGSRNEERNEDVQVHAKLFPPVGGRV